MSKRRWTVPRLCEFYPLNPSLLGLNHNHGEKIELRLRSHHSQHTFLPYEAILSTLLHELAHIEVGPHNARFYRLLDELRTECDALIQRGDDGTGTFTGHGRKVGQGLITNVPRYVAREKALAAAEKRRRVGGLMSGGARKLGGMADIARLCDPREMALAAAERRLKDDVWCASGQAIDVDAVKDEKEIEEEDEDEVQVVREVKAGRRNVRGTAGHVPVRQNAAALAALQRAGKSL